MNVDYTYIFLYATSNQHLFFARAGFEEVNKWLYANNEGIEYGGGGALLAVVTRASHLSCFCVIAALAEAGAGLLL